ncbi:unnamed protein product [Vitrella brassicaformis CCMP3155]|uniref:SET domain-containing protein n=1 Tax=Vitrella brassicaformis (strain CCMP3155) TaxID=1169540 RepID=A0A0G4FHU4_VITBC|nr:unnamed protein product [Vitrella brassicaformis CCMP3155]|eukprot:CEM13017.1 unnamed protein product [Vitrella brassicaformis CCMP3155]
MADVPSFRYGVGVVVVQDPTRLSQPDFHRFLLWAASCVRLVRRQLLIYWLAPDDHTAPRQYLFDVLSVIYGYLARVGLKHTNPLLDVCLLPLASARDLALCLGEHEEPIGFTDGTAMTEEPAITLPLMSDGSPLPSLGVPTAQPPDMPPLPPLPPVRQGSYRRVNRSVFAGTFDRLHAGHKLLLTFTRLLTKQTMILRITGPSMLTKKRHGDFLDPYRTRKEAVRTFVSRVRVESGDDVDIDVLNDPVGPAGTIDFDALVVTSETRRGGEHVNKVREENGKPPVELLELQVVGGEEEEGKGQGNDSNSGKLSSTDLRKHQADRAQALGVVVPAMRDMFRQLTVQQLKVDEEVADVWFMRLVDMHLEPWRHYHTLRHISDLISLQTTHSPPVPPPCACAISLAVWFHDAIYVPHRKDNEERSAELLEAFIQEVSLRVMHRQVADAAVLFVRATASHFEWAGASGAERLRAEGWGEEWVQAMQWFLDFDLSVLASEKEKYDAYADQIRLEYTHLAPSVYRSERAKFLRSLLDRPQLFSHLGGTAEADARRNIRAEVERLEQPDVPVLCDLSGGVEPTPIVCHLPPLIPPHTAVEMRQPTHFQYVGTSRPSASFAAQQKTDSEGDFLACSCSGLSVSCVDNHCPCVSASGGPSYTPDGLLSLPPGRRNSQQRPIIECHSTCGCAKGGGCRNRVAQGGVRWKLEVYWQDTVGWSVRTLEGIPRGAFVAEYAGEYLTEDEATTRLKRLDAENESRMRSSRPLRPNFLLTTREHWSVGRGERLMTTRIDAAECGSIARFINHSCRPNLQLDVVRAGSLIPRAVLFAREAIPAGTELSYAYGPPMRDDVGGRVRCHCGAPECTGMMPAAT